MSDLTDRLRVAANNLDHHSYPCSKSDRAWMAEGFRMAADALDAAEAKIADLHTKVDAIDAMLTMNLAIVARSDYEDGYDEACRDVWDILHPEGGES